MRASPLVMTSTAQVLVRALKNVSLRYRSPIRRCLRQYANYQSVLIIQAFDHPGDSGKKLSSNGCHTDSRGQNEHAECCQKIDKPDV